MKASPEAWRPDPDFPKASIAYLLMKRWERSAESKLKKFKILCAPIFTSSEQLGDLGHKNRRWLARDQQLPTPLWTIRLVCKKKVGK